MPRSKKVKSETEKIAEEVKAESQVSPKSKRTRSKSSTKSKSTTTKTKSTPKVKGTPKPRVKKEADYDKLPLADRERLVKELTDKLSKLNKGRVVLKTEKKPVGRPITSRGYAPRSYAPFRRYPTYSQKNYDEEKRPIGRPKTKTTGTETDLSPTDKPIEKKPRGRPPKKESETKGTSPVQATTPASIKRGRKKSQEWVSTIPLNPPISGSTIQQDILRREHAQKVMATMFANDRALADETILAIQQGASEKAVQKIREGESARTIVHPRTPTSTTDRPKKIPTSAGTTVGPSPTSSRARDRVVAAGVGAATPASTVVTSATHSSFPGSTTSGSTALVSHLPGSTRSRVSFAPPPPPSPTTHVLAPGDAPAPTTELPVDLSSAPIGVGGPSLDVEGFASAVASTLASAYSTGAFHRRPPKPSGKPEGGNLPPKKYINIRGQGGQLFSLEVNKGINTPVSTAPLIAGGGKRYLNNLYQVAQGRDYMEDRVKYLGHYNGDGMINTIHPKPSWFAPPTSKTVPVVQTVGPSVLARDPNSGKHGMQFGTARSVKELSDYVKDDIVRLESVEQYDPTNPARDKVPKARIYSDLYKPKYQPNSLIAYNFIKQ